MAHLFNTGPRVPCEIDGCDTDFARLADMQRHVKEHHGSPLLCPEPDCTWRGAKRKGRLEAHRLKAHADIHQGVELVIPPDFGVSSPEPSPYLLAPVAQPQSPVTGTTMNAYTGFDDESSHPRSSGPHSDSMFSATQNTPLVSTGTQSETNAMYSTAWNLSPQDERVYDQSFTPYQLHPSPPGDNVSTPLHPPLFPYSGDQFDGPVENQRTSSPGHQGSGAGHNENEGRRYS